MYTGLFMCIGYTGVIEGLRSYVLEDTVILSLTDRFAVH